MIRLKFPKEYQDQYQRIRMIQNAIFILINGGFSEDPLMIELQEVKNEIGKKLRQLMPDGDIDDLQEQEYQQRVGQLRAQLERQLWETITSLHSHEDVSMPAVTPAGTFLLADLMAKNYNE